MEEKEKQLLETIKIYSDLFRFALVAILATASGIVTLFYNAKTDTFGRTFTFGFFGNLLFIVGVIVTYYLWKEIKDLIKKLNS